MGPNPQSDDMVEVRYTGDGMETPVYSVDGDIKDHTQNGFTNLAYVAHADTDEHAHTDKTDSHVTDPENSTSGGEFRSLVPFCIFFGIGSLFSSSLSAFLSSQITVIEKSFGLSSYKSGLLLSANDIGFVAAVLFVSHFLKNQHIPRVLAICVLTFGVAGLLTSLPHFIADEKMPEPHPTLENALTNSNDTRLNKVLCYPQTGELSNITVNHCESKNTTSTEGEGSDSGNANVALVIIGVLMFVQGIAKAPRQALSSVFVDNNSEKTRTGFYIGILSSFGIFGPFIAILVGGLLNKIPVDLKETKLEVNDPRWIGAWWLGFVIFGACAVIASIPVFCFPSSMRRRQVKEEAKSTEYMNAPNTESSSFCFLIKDVPKSVLRVFMSPVYVCNLMSLLLTMFAILVLGSFGPKYIENQFHIPTWKANIVLGMEKLATTVLGTFLGGVLTRRLKLSMVGCIKMLLFCRVLSSISHSFLFIIGCDRPDIAGYDNITGLPALPSCDCSGVPYLPVCVDGQTYFSPCHAGCQVEGTDGYTQCSASYSEVVDRGMCDVGCNMLIPFIAVNAFTSFVGTAGIAPAFVTMLRSIQEKDRAMAVGLNSFLLSLLVFLPAPIVLGKMFDSFCLVWKDSCTGAGACSLYDNSEMRFKLISLDMGLKVGALIFTVLMLLVAIRLARNRPTDKTLEMESKSSKPPVPQPRLSLQNDSSEES